MMIQINLFKCEVCGKIEATGSEHNINEAHYITPPNGRIWGFVGDREACPECCDAHLLRAFYICRQALCNSKTCIHLKPHEHNAGCHAHGPCPSCEQVSSDKPVQEPSSNENTHICPKNRTCTEKQKQSNYDGGPCTHAIPHPRDLNCTLLTSSCPQCVPLVNVEEPLKEPTPRSFNEVIMDAIKTLRKATI